MQKNDLWRNQATQFKPFHPFSQVSPHGKLSTKKGLQMGNPGCVIEFWHPNDEGFVSFYPQKLTIGNGQSTSYTFTLANGYIYYVLPHDPGCVPNRNIGTSSKPHGDRLNLLQDTSLHLQVGQNRLRIFLTTALTCHHHLAV